MKKFILYALLVLFVGGVCADMYDGYMERMHPQEWAEKEAQRKMKMELAQKQRQQEAAARQEQEAAQKQQEAAQRQQEVAARQEKEKERIAALPRISAARLWRDYERNEIAADNAHRGREIVLKGRILSIDKTITGKPTFYIAGGRFGEGMPVWLERNQENLAAQYAPGDAVAVRCVVKGKTLGAPCCDDGIIMSE